MGYAYNYGCDSAGEARHICHDCPESRTREFGRVRSAGFIKKAYLATVLADPENTTVWKDGIASGNIVICPETSGLYDPGDPKQLKGYGNRLYANGPRTQKLTFNDPDYADNYFFYNELSNRTDLVPMFRTSTQLRIFDTVASVAAKDPIADDIESEVVWQVDCQVVSVNLPIMVPFAPLAEIFSCPTS